ncbi:AraC family transcriptional regulator [Tenacibaculum sp. Bg11-29]|uniref:helix-turn-helix domain-containing protein n=1 Tax=Tenacibaculum sp. Bg11-29 TaxID=2058306 RepID=UPI000C32C9BB|nr:AraC family transcriptional regulator [Tenacibaculum sp. Bg11-29]PKH52231.1 AraC family transcriptional regulator [Tenacibaculum sp. Bg11-29]
MSVENIPESYLKTKGNIPDLFVYDFKMTENLIKTKVNLNSHMFSFLQTGKKQVHFSDTSVLVDNSQSLLIKKGNCLWTELLDTDEIYYCKLLFFSDKKIKEFLQKHVKYNSEIQEAQSYFTIENDSYIDSYLNSLATIMAAPVAFMNTLLSVKFEELLLYLTNKYGEVFENYLKSLIEEETSPLKKTIEKNVYTSLSLEEIAFLCNMSLSTFKRHFIKEYKQSPGKWFRDKRLLRAKELLETSTIKVSDIYLDLGYNNLSNFSSAFKSKFGINPSEI